MLRLSRNGIGVLTSQYKSILKKCALLNLLAAGVFLFASAANAAGEVETGGYFSEMGKNVKEAFWDTDHYDHYNNPTSAYIFLDPSTDNLTRTMISSTDVTQTSWIVNYGDVYFGRNDTGSIVMGTVVSNKHNTFGSGSDITQVQSGGVIGNQNAYALNATGLPYTGAHLDVINTTFEDNSTTDFTKFATQDGSGHAINEDIQVTGGAISNVSIAAASVRNSVFNNNYTMNFLRAYGGAIYNGWDQTRQNDYDGKALTSANNTFFGNHVGNQYLAASGDVRTRIFDALHYSSICSSTETCGGTGRNIIGEGSSAYAISDSAYGGAVYNINVYTSNNDSYLNNYAFGKVARGGAVYNSDYIDVDAWKNAFMEDAKFTFSGDLSFSGNYAQAETKTLGNGQAYGGAIFNAAKMLFTDNVVLDFANNYVKTINGNYSDGGALYNANNNNYNPGDYHESIGVVDTLKNATFYGNHADAELGGLARGGAIYNAGRMIIADATFDGNYTNAIQIDSTVKSMGGAIYNAAGNQVSETGEKLYNRGYLLFDNRNSSNDIEFTLNEALYGSGGGIYNAGGTIYGVIKNRMLFSNNKDGEVVTVLDNEDFGKPISVSNGGGAIYNGANAGIEGAIRYKLTDGGNILFAKNGNDNVYNIEGQVIQFAGANNSAHALTDKGYVPASNLSNVTTFATFLGKGSYEIINTELRLNAASGNGAGYISLAPQMKMAYSEITLNSAGSNAAHMYLTSDNDILVDNDFRLDQNTILRYDDKDSTWKNKYAYDFTKTMELEIDPLDPSSETITFYKDGFVSANSAMGTFADSDGTNANNFYLGYYVENDGHIVYDDSIGQDTDVGIARRLVNSSNGVIRSEMDGYITKNIHIGTLENDGGKIYINMENDTLIRTDDEHKLIPIDEVPEGYQFGYYTGEHYNSEVITIDKAMDGEGLVVFYTQANTAAGERATRYSAINLGVGQRIYFAQTPGENEIDLDKYSFSVINGVNPNYEIKVGYDFNDETSVYDWFLYRGIATDTSIPPETMAAIDLPRSAVEQLRSLRLPLNRTNRGQCNCYKDECDNQFCKYEDSNFRTRLWATPFYRSGTFDKPFETDFDLFGVDFGMDFQPTTRDEIGIFGSYRNGKYENDGNKKHYGEEKKYFSYDGSEIKLQSWVAGGYYRRYVGDLYLMGALYAGKLDADLKGKNGVKASVDGITVGVQGETGYDIRMTKRSILTPSLRATYNYIDFDNTKDSVGKEFEFTNIHDVELEAALKLEYQFNNEHQLPTTGYIKPSIIQVLASGGKVKVDGREFKDTLDNETYGRIEVGADAELMRGFSLGVFGNYTAGSDYDAWGVGGNVRVVW